MSTETPAHCSTFSAVVLSVNLIKKTTDSGMLIVFNGPFSVKSQITKLTPKVESTVSVERINPESKCINEISLVIKNNKNKICKAGYILFLSKLVLRKNNMSIQ